MVASPMSRTFADGSTYIETSAYYLLSSSSSLFNSNRQHKTVRRIPIENKRERERARWMIFFFYREKTGRKREELEK
jgi:hypothetical protein